MIGLTIIGTVLLATAAVLYFRKKGTAAFVCTGAGLFIGLSGIFIK